MSLSKYAKNAMLNHILNGVSYPMPNLYLALCKSEVLETSNGSNIVEIVDKNYERVLCNSWALINDRIVSNAEDILFNESFGAWGDITYWAICDAVEGGNLIAFGQPNEIFNVDDGFRVRINSGILSVSVDSGVVSNYLANALLSHIFGIAEFSAIPNFYLGLSTGNPGDSGSLIYEPNGNNYSRIIANNWSLALEKVSSNTNDLSFPVSLASWGNITHVFIADALTGGNILFYSAMMPNVITYVDDIIRFISDAITITFN